MVDSLTEEFSADETPPIKAKFTNPKIEIGKVFKVDAPSVHIDDELLVPSLETDEQKEHAKQEFRDAHLAAVRDFEGHIRHTEKHGFFEVKDVALESLGIEKLIIQGAQKKIEEKIDEGFPAGAAIFQFYQEGIDRALKSSDEYTRNRAVEFDQHRSLLLRHLEGHPPITLEDMPQGSVLMTESLSIHDLMHFIDPETGEKRVEGIIVEEGSMHSHALILAQAMGIPCARVNPEDFDRFKLKNQVIMDGAQEAIHLSPSPDLIEKYQADRAVLVHQEELLEDKWRNDDRVTMQNGETFNVHVNLAMSYEGKMVRDVNPRGVGLYRTEVYMDARLPANEPNGTDSMVQKHVDIIRNAMRTCHPDGGNEPVDGEQPHYKAVTVRSIDIAGDKSDLGEKERAKRELDVTRDQFKAIAILKQELRELDQQYNPGDDVYERKLRVMMPNTRNHEHFIDFQDMMDEVAEEAGVPSVELGTMAENPAVKYALPDMDTDFVSIGSNDLWHFVQGVPRYGGSSNALYDTTEPAFLHETQAIIDICNDKGIKVSLCGNMASEIENIPILIGLGLRDISAGSAQMDTLKELASRCDPEECKELVAELKSITGRNAREQREAALQDFNQKHLGFEPDGTLVMDGFDTKTPNQIAAMRQVSEPDDDAPTSE